jgi:NAD(P)-dependent dehydrogenase (short-subunit alcohol dehydrogenase family)
MDLDIKGLRVLVTAGANGIGLAIVRAFAREGAKVHTCDVDEAALSALASSDPAITQSKCDVSDRAAVQKMFADAATKLGGLDVLVNNAGIAGPTSKVEEMNPEDWDRCLDICLTGQFNCTRLAVPLLRNSKNASIVNISSAAGRLGFAMRTPYAAAKWGVSALPNRCRSNSGRTTSGSTRSCPASSPATGNVACWKPRPSSVACPMPRWSGPRSPIPRSRIM